MLEPQERIELIDLLATLPHFPARANDRRSLLYTLSMERFIGSVELEGSSEVFTGTLLSQIEDYGPLPKWPGYQTLGVLLNYLVERPATPPADAAFLAGLIVRYGLIDDPNRPNYLQHLRNRYGTPEILTQIISDAGWSTDVIQNAYRMSLPVDWEVYHPDTRNLTDLPAMLRELSEAGATGSTVHMRAFSSRLERQSSDPAIHKRLRIWVNNAAPGGRIAIPSQTPQPPSPVAEMRPNHYLIVKIEPYSENNDPFASTIDRFLVRAWLISDNLGAPEPLHTDDKERQKPELEALLDIWVSRSAELLENVPGDIIIEMFLPPQLLSEDIDSWDIRMGRDKQPVGTSYPVVVRSWERLQDVHYRRFWKNKWSNLKSRKIIGETWFYWLGDGAGAQERLNAIYLNSWPIGVDESGQDQIFDHILKEGIPIALWPRHMLDCADRLPQAFKTVLLGQEIPHLPSLLFRTRRDRSANEQFWECVVLLLDDADRLPPDMPGSAYHPHFSVPNEARK